MGALAVGLVMLSASCASERTHLNFVEPSTRFSWWPSILNCGRSAFVLVNIGGDPILKFNLERNFTNHQGSHLGICLFTTNSTEKLHYF